MSQKDTPDASGMSGALLAVGAVLLSVFFLIMGNGVQFVLLPVRAEIDGFSTLQIGLLGSAYFLGFVLGCAFSPRLIARAGHIRTFTALIAIASAAALGYPIVPDAIVWIGLRLVYGFCLAGLYLVVESWLNDRATNATRGTLISTYVAINFAASTLGQLVVTFFDPTTFVLFSFASILISLAAVPLALTRTHQPAPITYVRFRPRYLYNLSPAGTVGVFLIGMCTGAFWSLAPSFATERGGSASIAALFMSAAVLGGALAQWPVGKISDRLDRRLVLIAIAAFGAVTGLLLLLAPALDGAWLLLALAFGAGILPGYAIASAHVFDFADRADYVEVSAGLLLLNGLGATIGPLLASLAIEGFGLGALLVFNALVQTVLIGFTVTRLRTREALPEAEKQNFDLGTSAAVSVVGDEEAVQLSDLVVESEPAHPVSQDEPEPVP